VGGSHGDCCSLDCISWGGSECPPSEHQPCTQRSKVPTHAYTSGVKVRGNAGTLRFPISYFQCVVPLSPVLCHCSSPSPPKWGSTQTPLGELTALPRPARCTWGERRERERKEREDEKKTEGRKKEKVGEGSKREGKGGKGREGDEGKGHKNVESPHLFSSTLTIAHSLPVSSSLCWCWRC